jgi:bifunctional non-homologous end joining protein LigD
VAITRNTLTVIPEKEFFAEDSWKGDKRVKIGKEIVKLTSLDRIYWPKERYTKFDLLKYYWQVSKTIIPYLKDRPLILRRFPAGITGQQFYQHNLEEAPEHMDTFPVVDSKGQTIHYSLVKDAGDLIYLANIGTIAQNPWMSRIKSLSKPDYFVFDLDPGDKASFETVIEVALTVKKVLDRVGLKGYPKTSGSSGIHIVVPVKPTYDYDTVVDFAKSIAKLVVAEDPSIATIERFTKNRKPKQIYVDYLQNLEGKSVAAAYSVREKPGATVSTPVTWAEIKKGVSIADFTIKNVPARLKKKGDIFKDALTKKQSLAGPMKKLEKLL